MNKGALFLGGPPPIPPQCKLHGANLITVASSVPGGESGTSVTISHNLEETFLVRVFSVNIQKIMLLETRK